MGGLLLVAIMLLYAYLGNKLHKNPLKWAFMGLGIVISVPLICSPFLLIHFNPASKIVFWSLVNFSGVLIGAVIAAYIAYKNNLIFKRTPGL